MPRNNCTPRKKRNPRKPAPKKRCAPLRRQRTPVRGHCVLFEDRAAFLSSKWAACEPAAPTTLRERIPGFDALTGEARAVAVVKHNYLRAREPEAAIARDKNAGTACSEPRKLVDLWSTVAVRLQSRQVEWERLSAEEKEGQPRCAVVEALEALRLSAEVWRLESADPCAESFAIVSYALANALDSGDDAELVELRKAASRIVSRGPRVSQAEEERKASQSGRVPRQETAPALEGVIDARIAVHAYSTRSRDRAIVEQIQHLLEQDVGMKILARKFLLAVEQHHPELTREITRMALGPLIDDLAREFEHTRRHRSRDLAGEAEALFRAGLKFLGVQQVKNRPRRE